MSAAAPVVSPRFDPGSFTDFEERYQPILEEGGGYCREWNDDGIRSAAEAFVWTVIDCDGRLYAVPGFATVNYVARVLCATPWGETERNNTGYYFY